jgi:hypothetical protein
MRSFLLALLLSLFGGGFGLWRASQEWSKFPDSIGEQVDQASAQKIESELQGATSAPAPSTGAADPSTLPKVEVVGGTEFDFGNMRAGTERSHEFRFRNAGFAPLTLDVVRSSCKCTIGALEKSVLLPGEETTVKLTWKAEGQLGDFAQTATIQTNDARRLEVQLTIRGKLGQTYMVEPAELSFGEFSSRDTLQRAFRVYSYEEAPLTINAYWPDSNMQQIKAKSTVRKLEKNEIPEHADARQVADVVVDVSPGLPAGPINGQISIEIGPDKLLYSVRCSGTCVSDLRIIAGRNYSAKLNSLQMGRVSSSEGATAKFFISSRAESDEPIVLTLKSITPKEDSERFQVTVGEPSVKASQTLFPISVVIPPDGPAFNRSGYTSDNVTRLTFQTNLENSKEISVDIRVVVADD